MAEGGAAGVAPDKVTMETADVRDALLTTLLQHVQRGEAREAGVIMESRSISEQLKSIAWDLVPQVCEYLTDGHEPAVIDTVHTVLNQLALKAKPKEVLLVLLEQADGFKDDVKFRVLLPAISTCLLQIPAKRGHSIAVAVETLYAHVQTLEAPQPQQLQGAERMLLENDEDVIRLNDITRSMAEFLQPLAKGITYREAGHGMGRLKDTSEQKELVRCFVKLLNHPIAVLDTSFRQDNKEEKVKTESRLNAERLMAALGEVQPDYVKLLEQLKEENKQIDIQKQLVERRKNEALERGDIPDPEEDYDVVEKHPELGLSVLAYLAYGEGLGLEHHPRVYTPQFLFEFSIPFISMLLSQASDPLVVDKGVWLLRGALSRIPDGTMQADILEWDALGHVVGHLVQVMTQSQDRHISRLAVSLLPLWLRKFNSAGRHKSLYFVLMRERHPGLVGYTIQLLKDEILRVLSSTTTPDLADQGTNPPVDHYFSGQQLEKLLALVLKLQKGAQTDILEQSDRVMAALNLLRYIVLRDPLAENRTGVWSYMKRVETELMEPLHTALDMSRAHYELEMRKVLDGNKGDVLGKQRGVDVNFEVGGKALPNLTPQQELEVMQTALHTFDVMQSVLVRTEEIINQQRRQAKSST